MLKLYESLFKIQVLSLRVGGPVADVIGPVINPNNLFIEGWFVEDVRDKKKLILLTQDIRDFLPQGFVVDDHEVLVEAEDLVRLKDILELQFELLKLKVVSSSGKSYGRVTDFAFETGSFYIKKIYASQPLVKNFAGGTLSIDRNQIIEITNRRIVIEDPTESAKVRAVSPSIAG